MIFTASHLCLALALTVLTSCEDWFIPDSHLISDVEFNEKVLKDSSTLKVVKFFTPNCVYCRYLKATMDKLKKEKQWSFQIYDLNCAWYPKFCNEEIKASAFPFTAVYNQKGEEEYKMVGFYPENVILEVFQKVEEASLELKNKKKQASSEQPQTNQPTHQQQQSNNLEQQTHNDNHSEANRKLASEEPSIHAKPKSEQASRTQQNSPSHLDGAFQHIFFATCILLGVVYFSSFTHLIRRSSNDLHNPEAHSHLQKCSDVLQ